MKREKERKKKKKTPNENLAPSRRQGKRHQKSNSRKKISRRRS
jgi:hypothetical protein